MKLSKRLESLMEMVPECVSIADIGTDHAFLPIRLIEENKISYAIASDIGQGPLNIAHEHVKEKNLEDRISLRLGDGLKTVKTGEAECIIIAGMGGMLVASILENGKEVLSKTRYLLLSPHTDAYEVRKKAAELSYKIISERTVFDSGKYYTHILTEKCVNPPVYTETELKYGPCLIKEKPGEFLEFLKRESQKNRAVLRELKEKNDGKLSALILEKEESETEIENLISEKI